MDNGSRMIGSGRRSTFAPDFIIPEFSTPDFKHIVFVEYVFMMEFRIHRHLMFVIMGPCHMGAGH